jgi:hypothetical protein
MKSLNDFILPRMGNGPCLTCLYTGKRRPVHGRFAGAALIFELFSFVLRHRGHRLISQGIIGILILHHKDVCRACGHTIATTVAQVRVNGDVKFTGGVFIPVVCPHHHSSMNLRKLQGIKRDRIYLYPPHPGPWSPLAPPKAGKPLPEGEGISENPVANYRE